MTKLHLEISPHNIFGDVGFYFNRVPQNWGTVHYKSNRVVWNRLHHPVNGIKEYPVLMMTDKIQDASGDHPGDNIIYHDPHAAMYIAVKPADLPRFPHIQDTENHKPGGNPLPVIGRQRHERDPHTNKFVPDNAAVIVHAHVFRRLMTKIDADTDPQHHHQRVELPGQKGHQIPERDRRQRSHRARNDWA